MSKKNDDERFQGSSGDPELTLKEALLRIDNTSVEVKDEVLWVSNDLDGFKLPVHWRSVHSFEPVVSPYGETCLKMDLSNGGFVIATPNDFVFDVTQEGFAQVSNLPPICSLRELMAGFEGYSKNPEQSDNSATNVGNYLFQRALIESALIKGLDVEVLARRLNQLISGTYTEELIQVVMKDQAATWRDFACLAGKLSISEVDEQFIKVWNQYFRRKPWEFFFGLTNEISPSLVSLRLEPNGTGAFAVLNCPGGIPAAAIRVEFNIPDGLVVLNQIGGEDLLQVESIFPQFLGNLVKFCSSLGIEKLHGHLSGAASYLGAKAGFLPTREEWFRLRAQLRKRLEEFRLSDADRRKVLFILESDDPTAIWELVDLDLPYATIANED